MIIAEKISDIIKHYKLELSAILLFFVETFIQKYAFANRWWITIGCAALYVIVVLVFKIIGERSFCNEINTQTNRIVDYCKDISKANIEFVKYKYRDEALTVKLLNELNKCYLILYENEKVSNRMGKIECSVHRSEIEAVWEKIKEKHNEAVIKRIALNTAKLEYTRKLWNEVQESDKYYIKLKYESVDPEGKSGIVVSEQYDFIERAYEEKIKIALFANGGHGKTFTLRKLAGFYAKDYMENTADSKFPLFLEVKDCQVGNVNPIQSLAVEKLRNCLYFATDVIDDVGNTSDYMFFIDALDEAKSDEIVRNAKTEMLRLDGRISLSCRFTHQKNVSDIKDIYRYKVCKIDKDQKTKYLQDRFHDVFKDEKLPKSVAECLESTYLDYCDSPFLIKCYADYIIRNEDQIREGEFALPDKYNELPVYFIADILSREFLDGKTLNNINISSDWEEETENRYFKKLDLPQDICKFLNFLSRLAGSMHDNEDAKSYTEIKDFIDETWKENPNYSERVAAEIVTALSEICIFKKDDDKYSFFVDSFYDALSLPDGKIEEIYSVEQAYMMTAKTRVNNRQKMLENEVSDGILSGKLKTGYIFENYEEYGGPVSCIQCVANGISQTNLDKHKFESDSYLFSAKDIMNLLGRLSEATDYNLISAQKDLKRLCDWYAYCCVAAINKASIEDFNRYSCKIIDETIKFVSDFRSSQNSETNIGGTVKSWRDMVIDKIIKIGSSKKLNEYGLYFFLHHYFMNFVNVRNKFHKVSEPLRNDCNKLIDYIVKTDVYSQNAEYKRRIDVITRELSSIPQDN